MCFINKFVILCAAHASASSLKNEQSEIIIIWSRFLPPKESVFSSIKNLVVTKYPVSKCWLVLNPLVNNSNLQLVTSTGGKI